MFRWAGLTPGATSTRNSRRPASAGSGAVDPVQDGRGRDPDPSSDARQLAWTTRRCSAAPIEARERLRADSSLSICRPSSVMGSLAAGLTAPCGWTLTGLPDSGAAGAGRQSPSRAVTLRQRCRPASGRS